MDGSSKRGLSRREVIVGGVTVVALGSCYPAPNIDDGFEPVAYWPEDDEMTAPLPQNLTQPLVLWASIIAPPNSDSPVPNEMLMNPLELPMELLEVRFRMFPIGDSSTDYASINGMGLGVKMDLGKAPIIDAGVPVSMLGTVRDTFENGDIVLSPDSGTITPKPATYSWRLKYPLFVPAGKTPSVVFTPMGQNVYPLNVDVAYICRTWDMTRPQPTKTKVPWVASYQSKTFDYATAQAAGYDTSPTLDILNPFGAPLELQRISGRVLNAQSTATAVGSFTNSIIEDVLTYRSVLSELRLRSSRGFDLIRTPAAFNGFFPMNWRAWDVPDKWTMAAQEFYRAQLTVNAVTDTVSALARIQFALGVVGYRDVEVASLVGDH